MPGTTGLLITLLCPVWINFEFLLDSCNVCIYIYADVDNFAMKCEPQEKWRAAGLHLSVFNMGKHRIKPLLHLAWLVMCEPDSAFHLTFFHLRITVPFASLFSWPFTCNHSLVFFSFIFSKEPDISLDLFHLTGSSHETTLLHLALMEDKERHLPMPFKFKTKFLGYID